MGFEPCLNCLVSGTYGRRELVIETKQLRQNSMAGSSGAAKSSTTCGKTPTTVSACISMCVGVKMRRVNRLLIWGVWGCMGLYVCLDGGRWVSLYHLSGHLIQRALISSHLNISRATDTKYHRPRRIGHLSRASRYNTNPSTNITSNRLYHYV